MRNKEHYAEWCKEYRDKHKADKKALYEARKAAGLCIYCGELAVPDRTLCAKHAARHKAYQQKRRPANNEYWKKRYADNPRKSKDANLKNSYGISIEEYEIMFEKQGGRCAICGKHQSELTKRLFVDHDHKTGQVRGLLCANCNAGLGHFYDDRGIMFHAIVYIAHKGDVQIRPYEGGQ